MRAVLPAASEAGLLVKGVPGSPYTRKLTALLRYRHIPYRLLLGDQALSLGLPEPKVALLPTVYLPGADGSPEALVDTTPLFQRLEALVDGRSVMPKDPLLNFLNLLVEDYGDEWLTKAMFHYRWSYADDIDKASKILPLWSDIGQSPEQHAKRGALFSERQIGRLHVVGSNAITGPTIERSYQRFLAIFDELLQRQTFVLGARPSTADFALYAQLTQLAQFDPTPATLCHRDFPRVAAWTDVVDDLSGHPGDENTWLAREHAAEHLRPLLGEIGRVYAPALLANAQAIAEGAADFSTEIDGERWEQPVFRYQARCLVTLRQLYAALPTDERDAAAALLAGTGCESLFRGL